MVSLLFYYESYLLYFPSVFTFISYERGRESMFATSLRSNRRGSKRFDKLDRRTCGRMRHWRKIATKNWQSRRFFCASRDQSSNYRTYVFFLLPVLNRYRGIHRKHCSIAKTYAIVDDRNSISSLFRWRIDRIRINKRKWKRKGRNWKVAMFLLKMIVWCIN